MLAQGKYLPIHSLRKIWSLQFSTQNQAQVHRNIAPQNSKQKCAHHTQMCTKPAKQESRNVHNSTKPQQVTCRLWEEGGSPPQAPAPPVTIAAVKPHINKQTACNRLLTTKQLFDHNCPSDSFQNKRAFARPGRLKSTAVKLNVMSLINVWLNIELCFHRLLNELLLTSDFRAVSSAVEEDLDGGVVWGGCPEICGAPVRSTA